MSAHYSVKQVILVPRDLKNAKGLPVHPPKMMAQCAHAAMAWLGTRFRQAADSAIMGCYEVELSPSEEKWLVSGDFAKIVLGVENQAEMLQLIERARAMGLTAEVIEDAGHTEFDGRPTITCAAIGPNASDRIDLVTSHLKLL
jgi:PTH2 family peptidyl-tRNA hydrolase